MKFITSNALVLIIAAAIAGLLLGVFQPFVDVYTDKPPRTVVVEGSATTEATPDEFEFYPYYEAKNTNRATARTNVTKTGESALADIKALGVSEDQIRVEISVYEDYSLCVEDCQEPTGFVGSYAMTISTKDKAIADKVQTYLLDSEALGSVTPSATLSEDKMNELKAEARAKAVENARTQANQLAAELNAKTGDVVSVEEVNGFDSVMPFAAEQPATLEARDSGVSSTEVSSVLPGQQEVRLTVKVTFEIQ